MGRKRSSDGIYRLIGERHERKNRRERAERGKAKRAMTHH